MIHQIRLYLMILMDDVARLYFLLDWMARSVQDWMDIECDYGYDDCDDYHYYLIGVSCGCQLGIQP